MLHMPGLPLAARRSASCMSLGLQQKVNSNEYQEKPHHLVPYSRLLAGLEGYFC